jgi:hypothetical protein
MVDLETRSPGRHGDSSFASQAAAAAPSDVPAFGDNHPSPGEPPLLDLAPVVRESPPWLFSALLHLTVLIVLGLLFLRPHVQPDLQLEAGYTENPSEQVDEPLDQVASDKFQLDENALTPDKLPEVSDPLATPQVSEVMPNPLVTSGVVVPTTIGVALSGREPGMKEALLKAFGGTTRTEGAVALGLRWLASRQKSDGLWSLTGPYSNGSQLEDDPVATALALLAFQGAGYTHRGDPQQPFTPVVRRGLRALLKQMDADGRFYHDLPSEAQLYTQAICTIAVCEAFAMTNDEDTYDAAQKAVDHCVKIQAPPGGWRYEPGIESDMSVTGWFTMALQSARMAGIEVPSPVFERISGFLDTVAREDGRRYAYRDRDGATLTLTAEGLLCRQYLGWAHDDPRLVEGVSYLLDNLPQGDRANVYYWYYATQVCHHMEGDTWRQWNDRMRVFLPDRQEKRGKERGSWDPVGDRWGDAGGRLYVTCLSLYILEVYYRHLPIYETGLSHGG